LLNIIQMINLSDFKSYRRFRKGIWYKHYNLYQIPGLYFTYFWARYPKINGFSEVRVIEDYTNVK
jgi:hypothetical protein